MKKLLGAVVVMILFADINTVNAHSGGTDRYGCHTNHSTGEYHCHNSKRNENSKSMKNKITKKENKAKENLKDEIKKIVTMN